MDDSFELEYADDLEALGDEEDYDVPSFNPPKSKRSLQFETPNSKVKPSTKDQDDILNLEEVMRNGNSIQSSPDSPLSPQYFLENVQKRKRLQNFDTSSDDLEDFLLSPPNQSLSGKRPRIIENDIAKEPVASLEENSNTSMIKIVQQLRQAKASAQVSSTQPRLNDAEDIERPRVHKRIPKCDFVSAVGYEGQRVYMKLWDEDVLEAEYSSIGSDSRSSALLSTPVCVLREHLEDEKSKNILQESTELHERINSMLGKNVDEGDTYTLESTETDNRDTEVSNERETNNELEQLTNDLKMLWVEKYAPRKYTELLSEEAINRRLLHWLKLWDYVVFGKNVPKPTKKNTHFKNAKEKDEKVKKKIETGVTEELDKFNRPEQKVALLCGPPGLGKTTLAHIVAAHAGYNVVEMNASDDRSVDVFKTKIESATQMKSVIEADPRPNCLIIDEIDGAPAPAINVLLNIIKMTDNETGTNGKKKKGQMLLRPIICVCNDQYVPALRQLRQMALVLNFSHTESSRLASRLLEVVREEMLKTDLNALLALCQRTDNDIRSCLNTLQFVKQKQKELTMQDVQTMNVGQKDTQKSLFTVWHEVFTMKRVNKNKFISVHDIADGKQEAHQTNTFSPTSRFHHIYNLCQSAGEIDRIMQGLQENYLEAKSKDPHLNGLNLANEWLCYADICNQYIARSQDYSVMKYTVFVPIVFHFLYASYSPLRIQFPHSQYDASQKLMKTMNLLTTLISDMTPMARKFNNAQTIVLDLLTPLLEILQPTLRPVNTQLYSNREKEELSNVVKIMMAYNMTYRQEKTQDGQYIYALDPNVEEITKFPGLKQRKQLTYAAKQMIAREIELEKMRRTESNLAKPREELAAEKPLAGKSSALPNHLQKLEAKTPTQDRPTMNFFEKFTKTKRQKLEVKEVSDSQQDKMKKELLDTVIWFHFKEGFSNAVRRNVQVQDLL
ncbi:Chromosome transmission fidelity protein 18 [Bulinus truncatus]|nr:Chromosome transmission fidelity protein 18 [Bulinus truncatus]